LRIATVRDWHKAAPVVEYSMWGANKNLFRSWSIGDPFVLLVGMMGVVWGHVSGACVRSDLMIWDDDLYEWRIPLAGVKSLTGPAGSALNRSIRNALSATTSGAYGHYVHNQTAIPSEAAASVQAILEGTHWH
jgi:hypothetical protein